MLVHRIPNDEDPVRGEDIAIWSNDSAIVTTIEEFAKDIFDGGLDYKSYNLIRPSLSQITNWVRSLDIDYKEFLANIGRELGIELSKNCKSKTFDKLFKEMQTFWDKHNLGSIKITKKKPIEIAMENNMDCHEQPEIARAICQFIKSMVEAILSEKLGLTCKVQEVDCKPEQRTFCKFRVEMKK
jgi:predicted hydrocarbon binding protein